MTTLDLHGAGPWRAWYAVVNASILLAAAVAVALVPGQDQRVLYVTALTALCTSPLLVVDRLNGRYTLLCAFLAVYFLYFGVADLIALFEPGGSGPETLLTSAEIAVILGASLLIAGYHAAVRCVAGRVGIDSDGDWPDRAVVLVGALLWLLGTAAVWYWSVHVVVRRSVEIDNQLGSIGTTAMMLGRLLQPLGILILAYGLALTRNRLLLTLVLVAVLLQVVLGFISDSKETAMRGAVLVILVKFLVDGRLPKAWLAAAVAALILAFPIFQAYRYEVTGLRGVTNQQAAEHLGEMLAIAWQARDKVASGFYGEAVRGQSFFERASLKGSVELIIQRTGHDVPYQMGGTLHPLITSFIPRLIWPNKPDVAAGQLMNREFGIAWEQDVYISPSHLGEMYWNFGWPGVVIGMFALGGLLGFINCRWNLSDGASLTRLLVVSITLYALCLRFEGTIATGYAVWLRSLAAIALLHWLFARPGRRAGERAQMTGRTARARRAANLMH